MSVGPKTPSSNKWYLAYRLALANESSIATSTFLPKSNHFSPSSVLLPCIKPHIISTGQVWPPLLLPPQGILDPGVTSVFKTHQILSSFCYKTFQRLSCHTWNKSQTTSQGTQALPDRSLPPSSLIYPAPILGLNVGPHEPSFSVLLTSQARCYLRACVLNTLPCLFQGQSFSSFRSQATSPPHILCILDSFSFTVRNYF